MGGQGVSTSALEAEMARRRQEDNEPGRLDVSDPKTKQFVFGYAFDTVMDWRNLNVLIGKIVQDPGLQPTVDVANWQKSSVTLPDVEAPLVDVHLAGRLYVVWDAGATPSKDAKKKGTGASGVPMVGAVARPQTAGPGMVPGAGMPR